MSRSVLLLDFISLLFSGRTLLDMVCLHHGDGSTKEEAKELCHRMLVLGLLQPFSELRDDSAVAAGFNVRAFS